MTGVVRLSGLRCPWPWLRCPWGRVRGARGLATPPDLHVPQDVLLFRHEQVRYHRLMGFFAVNQLVCWGAMAGLAFSENWSESHFQPLIPVPSWVDLSSKERRYGIGVFCLGLGSTILVICAVFARRSVGQIVLRQGGQDLTFKTYHLFGLESSFTVPVSQVSCKAHRSRSSTIPLKIKGYPFYFVLHNSGQIFNTKLFNLTVGTYRTL
uniref:Transmembrane protein 223 n=1 Tax=Pelusios castaneus TaxID=367368 RepID=A0A8C8RP74_9SAUR